MLFPIVPLRCCLYVACPSDLDQYLTNTDIWVYVGMGLKTVETVSNKSETMGVWLIREDNYKEGQGMVLLRNNTGSYIEIN